MSRPARLLSVLLLMAYGLFGHLRPVFAHGEQIAVGGGVRGPVILTEQQRKAIDLQTVAADFRTLDQILTVNSEVRLLPQRQADVSLRISGRVTAIHASLGDRVERGQELAEVESRLSGDPPPNVVITAPMSGVIDARNVILGQAVEPTVALFHISDRSQVIVAARLYEEDLGKVRPGMEARVRALGYPDQAFTGKVTLIEPVLDPSSRTVKAWIEVANPKDLLRPNMFARAAIVLQRNEAALSVPNGAVMEANGETFVFVREGKQFRRVEVTTGAADDSYTEITSELVPGDEVVTQGNRELYTMWLTGGQMKEEE
ncbi:MAG: efflux RND transporter periplasmic adaptor subunit [Gammaproteobacteria bacterium]|nr:efflux RND transporter periplasmic adaptor subunit [Gammaproteobacteria bacterium]